MELLKFVYFCTQKSVIKVENNKFQDLINVPRILFDKVNIIVIFVDIFTI